MSALGNNVNLMPRLTVSHAKAFFFRHDAILKPIERDRRNWLSRCGAYLRTTARGLIRSAKKSSQPGDPPKSHTGFLKRFLYFVYDPSLDATIVGPAITNQYTFNQNLFTRASVPEALEHGGQKIKVIEKRRHGATGPWTRVDLRRNKNRTAFQALRATNATSMIVNETEQGGRPVFTDFRVRTVTIAARPYMGPALEMNADKLLAQWPGATRL